MVAHYLKAKVNEWVLHQILHLNLFIGTSVQSASCYCQICKGPIQHKWVRSIMSLNILGWR